VLASVFDFAPYQRPDLLAKLVKDFKVNQRFFGELIENGCAGVKRIGIVFGGFLSPVNETTSISDIQGRLTQGEKQKLSQFSQVKYGFSKRDFGRN
jgi:hypothetical protein